MLTIALKNVKMYGYVGLYPQEMQTGNELEFDVGVSIPAPIHQLPMIDYEWLYSVIKDAVAAPHALLEELVQIIVGAIMEVHPGARIHVAVRKLHPPLSGQIAAAEVAYTTPDQ